MADNGWREAPIEPEAIPRAQVLERIFVPHPPAWAFFAEFWEHVPGCRILPPQHLFVPADDPWPCLPRMPAARAPDMSDVQMAAHEADHERHCRAAGVTLGIARLVVEALDLVQYCDKTACRRAGRCAAERKPAAWTQYPGPAWPWCVYNGPRAALVRKPTEALILALDEAIAARLEPLVGQPWRAADHVGLTALSDDAVAKAVRDAMEELAERQARGATPGSAAAGRADREKRGRTGSTLPQSQP